MRCGLPRGWGGLKRARPCVVKKLSEISVTGIDLPVRLSVVRAVVNGSLDLAARAARLGAFLFD
jgi:hypothetical protein